MAETFKGAGELETGHVGLSVTDLERSKRFYRDVLGLEVVAEDGLAPTGRRYAFLGRGGRIVVTLFEQAGAPFDGRRAGLHHLSFQAPSIAAVEDAVRRLRELGVRVYHGGIVAHAEGAASGGVFFADPDGTRLEIFAASGAGGRPAPAEGPACGFF